MRDPRSGERVEGASLPSCTAHSLCPVSHRIGRREAGVSKPLLLSVYEELEPVLTVQKVQTVAF